jgi:hypothetical protein
MKQRMPIATAAGRHVYCVLADLAGRHIKGGDYFGSAERSMFSVSRKILLVSIEIIIRVVWS